MNVWEKLKSSLGTVALIGLSVVAIVFGAFFFRDIKRSIHGWTSETVMEQSEFTPVDYCRTRSRLSCILERTPQSVLDFCQNNYKEGTKCVR